MGEILFSGEVMPFLVALGLGGLIGVERERHKHKDVFAGIRTLPLVALLGATLQFYFPSLRMVGFLLVAILVGIGYYAKAVDKHDIGMTTAVASILTYVFGAMCTHSPRAMTWAIILSIVTASLLVVKEPLHSFAHGIEKEEMRATLKFLIIALVVLPLLPNRPLPYALGLNPRFVWMMVVFVSGIGYSAYVLSRLLGARLGIAMSGILGGMVSSTATAVSMSDRGTRRRGLEIVCSFSIVVASLAMFPRVLIEVLVVNPGMIMNLVPPIVMMAVAGLVPALVLLWRSSAGPDEAPQPELENPFRLVPALLFGGVFGMVLLLVEYLYGLYGQEGLYVASVLSGLADVDAITLSLGKLAGEGHLAAEAATEGIILASMTNTMVKATITWIVGNRRMGLLVTGSLGLAALIGGGWILLI
ncbi:MAG: MgtC/SapB family protein [bacterium]